MNDRERDAAVTALVLAEGCPVSIEADLAEAQTRYRLARDRFFRTQAAATAGPLALSGACSGLATAAIEFVRLAELRQGYTWAALARKVDPDAPRVEAPS